MATPEDDIITGTGGDDLLEGLAGNDTFFESAGSDTLYGNARANTAATGEANVMVYSGRPEDYAFAFVQPPRSPSLYTVGKPGGGTDSLYGIQLVRFAATGETLRIEDVPRSGGTIDGTDGDDVLIGRAGNDTILAREGSDLIIGSGGSDTINGFRNQVSPGESPFPRTDGVYDQVNYTGAASDYVFTGGANNTVRVQKPGGGVDTLSYVEGLWFYGEEKWYAIADLIDGAVIDGGVQSDVIYGTRGNDTINAGAGNDTIAGSTGSDAIDGGGGGYDQVDYSGAASDYSFVRDGDVVMVGKPGGGTDRLAQIDGIWFAGEGAWYALGDLIEGVEGGGEDIIGSDGDDNLTGSAGDDLVSGMGGRDVIDGTRGFDVIFGSAEGAADTEYDQVDYSGDRIAYRFERAGENVFVFKPDGSRDTLNGIDGIWFGGEGAWYSMASLLGPDVAA